MQYSEYKKAWNERVSEATSHIKFIGYLTKEGLYSAYRKALGNFDMNERTILDFGCGGGHLGRYLFDRFDLKKYIGLDISRRSIQATKNNLADIPEDKKEFILIDFENINSIAQYKPDCLISLSVLQHMPDREYYDKFIKLLNESGAGMIILQIRQWHSLQFQNEPYKTTKHINMACFTNKDRIDLTNYRLISARGGVKQLDKPRYQYLLYRQNE